MAVLYQPQCAVVCKLQRQFQLHQSSAVRQRPRPAHFQEYLYIHSGYERKHQAYPQDVYQRIVRIRLYSEEDNDYSDQRHLRSPLLQYRSVVGPARNMAELQLQDRRKCGLSCRPAPFQEEQQLLG